MEKDKKEDMGGRSEGFWGAEYRRKEGAGVNSTWI